MDKVSDPVRVVVMGLWLGHFVLVVGEDQIDAPRVDVHILPQNSISHSRTFNVPARSAVSPRGLPERLSRFDCFPERKIFLVSLAWLIDLSSLGFSFGDSLQFAIFKFSLVLFDIEVDWALGLVGIAILDYFLNESGDLGHVLGDSGQIIGILNSQGSALIWVYRMS